MSDENEITLEQAAKLYTDSWRAADTAMTDMQKRIWEHAFGMSPEELRQEAEALLEIHPANVPGAEATAVLETMLAASRKGKVVRNARL